MRKFTYLLLVVVLMVSVLPGVMAQEEEEMPEVVAMRLMEYMEMLPELEHYNTVSVDDFAIWLIEEDVTILDVREVAELEEKGTIEGAINIPMRELGGDNLAYLPDTDATIVVVCGSGYRAVIAMTALHVLGYENAYTLTGGFGAWVDAEMPSVALDENPEAEMGDMPEIDEDLVEFVSDYMANLPEGWGAVRVDDLATELIEDPPDLLLDVRSPDEWDEGYIEGAEYLWINELYEADEIPGDPDLDANIVIYCGGGVRGNIVATLMGMVGYENVRNLAGGIKAWVAAEFPLVTE